MHLQHIPSRLFHGNTSLERPRVPERTSSLLKLVLIPFLWSLRARDAQSNHWTVARCPGSGQARLRNKMSLPKEGDDGQQLLAGPFGYVPQ